jgi:hypothetical protein
MTCASACSWLRAQGSANGGGHRFPAGKKVNGTKRHIVVDPLGLLLTVLVAAASV